MPNGWGSGPHGKLEAINGIGPSFAARLRRVGVRSLHSLLKKGGTRKGRKEISQKVNIPETRVLEWIHRADLFRIKGVGEEYSVLLKHAGVDTVGELRWRNPRNLHKTLADINQTKNLVRKLPTEEQVAKWIEQAKELPRIVKY